MIKYTNICFAHSYSAVYKVKIICTQVRLKDALWHIWTFCSRIKGQSAIY